MLLEGAEEVSFVKFIVFGSPSVECGTPVTSVSIRRVRFAFALKVSGEQVYIMLIEVENERDTAAPPK